MDDRCRICGYPRRDDGFCGHTQTEPGELLAEVEKRISAEVAADLRALWARSIAYGGTDSTAADIQNSVASPGDNRDCIFDY